MAIREKVILEGEDRASESFDKAGGSFEKMGGTLKRVAIAGGVAIAAQQLGRLGSQLVSMAVDAEEAESAFKTTFGQALPQASAFVEEFANKAGFATGEMQQMLAVTGNVLQGIGATETESAALAESMATLAGDVASFSNATGGAPAVLQALQSALNGEREALKTYGLALSEAEVQQQALLETGKESADELTRLEKAQATMTLAYEKAGKAVGDLDRTQDSAANTIRRIQARAKEAGTAVGGALLPALEEVLPVIEDLIPAAEQAGTSIANFFASFSGTAAGGIGAIPDLIDGISIALNSVRNVGAGVTAALGEIFTLGFADTEGLQNTAKAAARMNDVIVAARDLTDQIAEGRPVADAFADGLLFVARRSDLSQEAIDRLGSSLGATEDEQRAALETLLEFANENNWRTENIEALRAALDNIGGTSAEIAAQQMSETADKVHALRQAAQETKPSLDELIENMPESAEAILELVPAAEEAAAAFRDDLLESANDFITGFEEIPEKLETTMDEFDENLTDRIAAQEEFWTNLTTLAEAGFGHLAEEIRKQGPAAAGLLEEAVNDMENAARLDEMIGEAGTQMQDLTEEYATQLEANADPTLTALGQFGQDMIDQIAAGIERGDLAGPLLAFVQREVRKVTGRTPVGAGARPPARPGGATGTSGPFQEGTWSVPGGPSDATTAVVHGTEIIIPPSGSSGRAEFARQLAQEMARTGARGGDTGKTISVTIEEIQVLVPAGTTVQEAVNAATAQAAIEAELS